MAARETLLSAIGRWTGKLRPLFDFGGDRALIGSGVAAAACSVVFAGYMIADRDRQPYFSGLEYLAIFSKPSHGIQVAAHPSPVLAGAETASEANGIDPTPTGSISGGSRAEPPDGAGLLPIRYRLVSASADVAWVESGFGFRQAKPGDYLPGLGRVAAIDRRNGRWALLTTGGDALLQQDEVGARSRSVKGPDERFDRPMIFGRHAQ